MLATATALLMSFGTGRVVYSQNPTDLRVALGSVYKPLALEEMKVPDKPEFHCPGKLYVDGRNFTCSHPRMTGPMDTRTALAYSCNNFFYHFGGLKALGEGVEMSPLELLQAYRRLALKHNAAVTAGMRDCVRYGTGQLANISGFEVAGKTGTPKGYAWFAGWAPADKPEVVFVVLTKPGTNHGSGGLDAAPLARDMLLKYLGRENEIVVRTADGVITLPLEEYVSGVLSGEASVMKSPEALKAMAVAARSYAVRFRGRHRDEGYDFCSTTHCQNFRPSAMNPAVEATAGEMLWRKGELVDAYYSQDCGGLNDSYCPRETWTSTIAPEEIGRALRGAGLKAPAHWQIAVVGRSSTGRVERLSLGDGVEISAEPFRLAIGRALGWNRLKSDLYTVNGFTFTGRGVGHGLGLCQRGAERMPGSFREILALFYPGSVVGLTAQGIDWRTMSGERVDVWATTDRKELVPLGDQLVRQVESETGLQISGRPRILLYPSVAVFRNATGEPGWVAASTKGRLIRVQPAAADRATLRHEMFHVLIETNSRLPLPLWFREGLALALAGGPVSSNAGYAAARKQVDACFARYGKGVVMGWLSAGLPEEVRRANATNPVMARQ
jgi:stage II sporulation protein D